MVSVLNNKNTSRTNALQFPTRLFHISAFIATYFPSGGDYFFSGGGAAFLSLNCILQFLYRKILAGILKERENSNLYRFLVFVRFLENSEN